VGWRVHRKAAVKLHNSFRTWYGARVASLRCYPPRKEFLAYFQIGLLLRKPIGRLVLSLPASHYSTRGNFERSILSWKTF
jgi:hypothetical protein